MAIERARAHALPKPWGVADLRPWSSARHANPIGEIWYERSDAAAADPSLLLKLLFTSQPLSIQVHPDDAFAHSIGLPNGKAEAWYVLSAAPGAKIALGLKHRITPQQLRDAAGDGSISNLVMWQVVSANDVISVPAGTIHAIGAGLILAEIQQRSDATFRLFDHGLRRELHIESAIAVADTGPAEFRERPIQLSAERTLLVSNSHFMFEKLDLPPNSSWCLGAEHETWFLVLSGGARVGPFDVAKADAVFAQSESLNIHAGSDGMVGLIAHAGGGQLPPLLKRLKHSGAIDTGRPQGAQMPISVTRFASEDGRLAMTK